MGEVVDFPQTDPADMTSEEFARFIAMLRRDTEAHMLEVETYLRGVCHGDWGWPLRLIFDELEAAIDPNAAKSFRRIERAARRDYDQRFWWRPSTTLPWRGPDLGAATGG